MARQPLNLGTPTTSADPILTSLAKVDTMIEELYATTSEGDLSNISQNIVPDGSNTRDLGSPTKRWKRGYFADGSLYIGDIKLSNDNGQLVVQQVTDAGLQTEAPVPDTPGVVTTDRIINGNHTFAITAAGDLVLDGSPFTGGGGNADTGTITFSNDFIFGSGTTDGDFAFGRMSLFPNAGQDFLNYGQYLNIYPTLSNDAPHIHIAAGKGGTSTGDLMLGDDTQYIDINHNGSVRVRTYDYVRGQQGGYWEFQSNGTLTGPAMGGVIVPAIIGMPGNGLMIYAGDQGRNEATVQFTDADGTEKSTFSVDMNSYPMYGISTQNYANLYWTVGGSVAITNIAFNENIATFTVSAPVTLAAGTDYLVEWGGTTYPDLTLQSNGGNITLRANGNTEFPSDKAIIQRTSITRTTAIGLLGGGVVWSSTDSSVMSAKLQIQIETSLSADPPFHIQICDAVVAYNANTGVEPVMTVYAITHTSTDVLATFSVQQNLTTGGFDVIATPGPGSNGAFQCAIHSVELRTNYY